MIRSIDILFCGWGRRSAWAMLAVGLLLQVFAGRLLDAPRYALFDLYERTLPRLEHGDSVVIVAADDASLKTLGQWPWPRQTLAELLSRILSAHPAALGLGVMFPEPDRLSPEQWLRQAGDMPSPLANAIRGLPRHDAVLALALGTGPVAIGIGGLRSLSAEIDAGPLPPFRVIGATPPDSLPSFNAALRSIPILDRAAPGHGLLSVDLDPDGIIRRMPLVSRLAGRLAPSFDLELLRLTAGAPWIDLYADRAAVHGIGVGPLRVPTQADGSVWIHFSPHDGQRFVSAADVLSGRVGADRFQRRIVLFAATALGTSDVRDTPVGHMPGAEIQAQALENILDGRLAVRPLWALGAEALLTFVLALLLIVSLPQLRPRWRAPVLLLILAALVATGFGLWWKFLLLLDVATPAAVLALVFVALLAGDFAEADAQRLQLRAQSDFIKSVFSHHVGPEVVDRILKDPAKMTTLEGERRTMTFLFTDIANFTAMSESLESKEVARVLNTYLEEMTGIVQKHGGMVDKFIGDAVMAIFNAPLDLPEHPIAAVRCALDVDRFSSNFSREQNACGIPFGLTRIGVHTGAAAIGNFGSRTRHSYTATGDAVNTASRLESLNKYFGTTMSVSGETRALCVNLSFRPTASVVLKGKSRTVEVWEPLQPDDFRGDFITRYCRAYSLQKNGAPDAAALFEELAREAPTDPCVAFHLERIRHGIAGVEITMTEK